LFRLVSQSLTYQLFIPHLSIATCVRDKVEAEVEANLRNQDHLNALKIT
jgi:hypothetical protein